jgi:hypothetical protein
VPDPSLYRRLGPFSRQPGGGTTNDWISLNITLANTVKPRNHQGDASDPNAQPQFMGDLPRPKSVLSYMDFGAAMVLPDKTRAQQIQIEQDLSQGSVARIAPGSQGVLPPPDNLLRSWPLLAGGQSCASETSVTNFVPPVVLAAGAQPPVPTTTAPVKAFVLAARAGDDGVNPLDTTSADAPRTMGQAGQLARVTLHPGATLTIQVRVLLAAFQANAGQPFKPLFLTRMREVTVVNDVEETRVLFSASADYPRFVSIQAAAGPALTGNITADGYANPGPVPAWGPKDRQQWAHALSLYNRSLRVYKRSGDEKLRNGSF